MSKAKGKGRKSGAGGGGVASGVVKPLITLCMIVKDEARDLPRCLQSVQGVADQIVVVDTGSTDGTIAIARKHGALVVRSAWTGDFAAARNTGLSYAQGEWILFLDADEELDAETGTQLRQLALEREIAGYFLNIWNYMGDGRGEGATINPVLRMFRNDPRYRFEGRIHEQIAGPITRHTPNARFHLSDAIIHHYGYRREVVAAKNKLQRNRTLLQQAVQEEPDNRFHWYNLGVEYFRGGEVEEAVRCFRQAREGIDFAAVSYAHLLVKHEAHGLQALGKLEAALELLEEGEAWYPDYTDLWHAKGVTLALLGRRRQAAGAFAAALQIGKPPALYHTEDGMGTYQSAYWLGTIYEAELDFDAAAHWYAEAVRFRSSLLAPLQRLCHMLRIAAGPERLAAFVRERFSLDSPQAAVKLAGIMLRAGCYEALKLWAGERLAGAGEEERLALLPWAAMAEACSAVADGRALLQPAAWTEGADGLDDGVAWLQGAEWLVPLPEQAVGWLPLLLRGSESMRLHASSAAGAAIVQEKVRSEMGRLMETASTGGENTTELRASVQALCALADHHLAQLQEYASHTQAAQSIRLLLPMGSGGHD